jgi:hypothetical protein
MPIATVEDKDFRNFAKSLCPSYKSQSKEALEDALRILMLQKRASLAKLSLMMRGHRNVTKRMLG